EGDAAQARPLVHAALAARPDDPVALCLAGRLELLGGRVERAQGLLARAIDADPASVEAHLELAALYRRARRLEDALDELALALHYDPDNATALFETGNVKSAQGALEGAIEAYRAAVEKDPGFAQAYLEMGYVMLRLRRFTDALEVLERGTELDPQNVSGQNNLGYVYVRLERYDRALEVFARLCARTPATRLGSRLNYGNALSHTGNFEASERVYARILLQEPSNFTAHWNRAHHVLARHEFAEGWREYHYRLQVDDVWLRRLIPFAPWKGEPLEGRTLLVSAEQGLGDQIMFASCLPEVVARAQAVVLECDHRLASLLQRSFPTVRVIGSRQEAQPSWQREVGHPDYHVPAGSLPGFFRNRLADFPRHDGYLVADPERVARWKARLAALGPGPVIGLSWRGGTRGTRRSFRSLAPSDLLPILRVPGLRFVSLQYGDCAEDLEALRRDAGIEVAHWPEAIADYEETAALCVALDMTVSVCTSVIHLNGALGRPVLVMVPAVPEWRYGVAGEAMPWYPSVRLVRQAARGDWSDVFARVASALGRRFAA
ncbi:MAG: tetratricopeptide repeat protein, partial [Burkholderiales bacterium]|nr:tetratricopeptide repeat protein [Burkholderiales bacterium]